MWSPWSVVACFGLAVVSAIFPWVNGELMLLAFAAGAVDTPHLLALVLAATAGQVVGKSTLFLLARHAVTVKADASPADASPPSKTARAIERWRAYGRRSPNALTALLLVSATLGMPPFYILTLVAGGLGIGFRRFLATAIVGRFLHFGGVALVPDLFESLWR